MPSSFLKSIYERLFPITMFSLTFVSVCAKNISNMLHCIYPKWILFVKMSQLLQGQFGIALTNRTINPAEKLISC